MLKNLTEIKKIVDHLADKINASACMLPTYGHTSDGARPHIEVDAQAYHYVVVERGEEIKRITTNDIDELLYQIFVSVTFEIAVQYELNHRIDSQDSRRIGFQRQVELLSMLSQEWGRRESHQHEEILRKYPFDDFSSIRVSMYKDLEAQGYSSEVAWQKACERYPLPDPILTKRPLDGERFM